jgi:hypothetical protein
MARLRPKLEAQQENKGSEGCGIRSGRGSNLFPSPLAICKGIRKTGLESFPVPQFWGLGRLRTENVFRTTQCTILVAQRQHRSFRFPGIHTRDGAIPSECARH